jgi:hypothetical protein
MVNAPMAVQTPSPGTGPPIRGGLAQRAFIRALMWLVPYSVIAIGLAVLTPTDSPWFRHVPKAVVLGGMVILAIQPFCYRRDLHRLRRASGSLCLHCGYRLEGLGDKGHCPECGRTFDVHRARSEVG